MVRASRCVGTNDANVWIGFNLGTGVAGQANWVNITGGNAVLPNRPVLGVAVDPSSPDVGTMYANIYAPMTDVAIAGGTVLDGSVLGKSLNISGDSAVHYDTH